MSSSFSDSSRASDGAPRISRRRFGKHAALAAALSISPAELLAALHSSRGQKKVAEPLTLGQTQAVEDKLANIIRKYGNRLSEDQRKRLRRILTYNERMLAAVRAFPLQNGDAPADVLKLSLSAQSVVAPMRPPGGTVAGEGNT